MAAHLLRTIVFGLGFLSGTASAQTPDIIAETTHFAVTCEVTPCNEVYRKQAIGYGQKVQSAYEFILASGFSKDDIELETLPGGKYRLRLEASSAICDAPKVPRQRTPDADFVTQAGQFASIAFDFARDLITPPSTIACVSLQGLGPSKKMQVGLDALLTNFNAATAAHELTHTFQRTALSGKSNWFDEAVAEAVGISYDVHHRTSDLWDKAPWSGQFTVPFYGISAEQDDIGYSRGAYLYYLGKRLGSKHGIAYLKDHLRNNASWKEGLERLYTKLPKPHRFDKSYPDFIATLNITEERGEVEWYETKAESIINVERLDAERNKTSLKSTIAPFSLHPHHIKLILPKPPSGRPEDSFAIATLKLEQPVDDPAMHMVIEHAILPEMTRSYLVHGDGKRQDFAFVRLINAAPSVEAGKPLPYELLVEYEATGTELGGCMRAGESYAIFNNDKADAAMDWRATVLSGGILKERRFVEVDGSAPVVVQVEIDNPVTRRPGSIAKAKLPPTTVTLGPFEMNSTGCNIRMTFPDSEAIATFDHDLRTTEIVVNDGTALYIREGAMMANIPGEGWIDLAKEMGDAVADGFVPGAEIARDLREIGGLDIDDDLSGHLPLEFARTFSRSAVQLMVRNLSSATLSEGSQEGLSGRTIKNLLSPGQSQINTNPIPCPDGGPECTSMPLTLMGETLADIIHDKAGDPLQIAFDHGAATFELQYGSYTLQGWPPNWAR